LADPVRLQLQLVPFGLLLLLLLQVQRWALQPGGRLHFGDREAPVPDEPVALDRRRRGARLERLLRRSLCGRLAEPAAPVQRQRDPAERLRHRLLRFQVRRGAEPTLRRPGERGRDGTLLGERLHRQRGQAVRDEYDLKNAAVSSL